MFEMRPRGWFLFRAVVSLLVVFLFTPLLHAQATIKVGDVNLRFGLLAQGWADATENPTPPGGYANNLFVRRIRFIVGGQINPNVSFFFETDNPNLGRATVAANGTATKVISTGFITQDAFVEWKPTGSTAFMIDGGLMLPPLCRNCLESAATLLSLDYGSFSFTEGTATQSVVGRDTGFLAKGYLAGGHFEYRAGIFSGFRAAGARNSLRTTARLSYNPWDTESGYVYPGMYFGNKRVLQFGGAIDHQQDYKGYSVDAFVSFPMRGAIGSKPGTSSGQVGPVGSTPTAAPAVAHDAVSAELTLLGFDGGNTFTGTNGTTLIAEQKAVTFQAGYYFANPKLMPWLRFERQDFRAASRNGQDNNRAQAGITWFPAGFNFNVKGAYSRVAPRVGSRTNEYTVQMQFFYY